MKGFYTLDRYYRHQVFRFASLIPPCGMQKELFIAATGEFGIEARRQIGNGHLPCHNGKVFPPLKIERSVCHAEEKHVFPFLNSLFRYLSETVNEAHRELSLEKKLSSLYEWHNFSKSQTYRPVEELLLKEVRAFLNRVTVLTAHWHKDQISKYYNQLGYSLFCDQRLERIREFHHSYGYSICAVFRNALQKIDLQNHIRENILELLLSYYEQLESYGKERVCLGLELLELYKKRHASSVDMNWVCHQLSDAYMFCFQNNDSWLEESIKYLDEAVCWQCVCETEKTNRTSQLHLLRRNNEQ